VAANVAAVFNRHALKKKGLALQNRRHDAIRVATIFLKVP
jgi:hypothetical protein